MTAEHVFIKAAPAISRIGPTSTSRWSSVAGTLYLALVVTALGYLVWNWALRRVKAARAAIFLCVQPVAGALLGVVLLGEPLTVFTLLGGGLIVGGLALAFGSVAR